jgi:hypothetical protein
MCTIFHHTYIPHAVSCVNTIQPSFFNCLIVCVVFPLFEFTNLGLRRTALFAPNGLLKAPWKRSNSLLENEPELKQKRPKETHTSDLGLQPREARKKSNRLLAD